MPTITLDIKLSDEGMQGFLCTMQQAIAYWDDDGRMQLDRVRCKNGWITSANLIYVDPASDDLREQKLDHAWVADAIAIALGREFQVASYIRETIYDCVVRDAVGEMDADAVDVVMQAGLFGELVYG